jgi:hypothetical protein
LKPALKERRIITLTTKGKIIDIESGEDTRRKRGKKTIEGNQKKSSAQNTTLGHTFVLLKRGRESGTKAHPKGTTREEAAEKEREMTTKAKRMKLR